MGDSVRHGLVRRVVVGLRDAHLLLGPRAPYRKRNGEPGSEGVREARHQRAQEDLRGGRSLPNPVHLHACVLLLHRWHQQRDGACGYLRHHRSRPHYHRPDRDNLGNPVRRSPVRNSVHETVRENLHPLRPHILTSHVGSGRARCNVLCTAGTRNTRRV